MTHTMLRIDGQKVNPECVRFVFQEQPTPGGHEYELQLAIAEIDGESLEFGDFVEDENPSEKRVRDWMYWLGHIVSRLHNPKNCIGEVWVVNNIQSFSKTAHQLLLRGECSKWVRVDA